MVEKVNCQIKKEKANTGRRKLKPKQEKGLKDTPFKGLWFHSVKPKEGSDDISEL